MTSEAPTELPIDWKLPQSWHDDAIRLRPDFSDRHAVKTAKLFFDYYRNAKAKKTALE